jgi:hypothetical protein
MFKATITNKEKLENGNMAVTVEFSDGTTTITETVQPQDKRGFQHWAKSRIESLNTSKELENENNVGKEINLDEIEETPTPAEQAFINWRIKYAELDSLVRYKQALEAAGISFTPKEITALANLANTVKSDFKANYAGKF